VTKRTEHDEMGSLDGTEREEENERGRGKKKWKKSR